MNIRKFFRDGMSLYLFFVIFFTAVFENLFYLDLLLFLTIFRRIISRYLFLTIDNAILNGLFLSDFPQFYNFIQRTLKPRIY